MSKLTKAARGQECTVMLFPYCIGFGDLEGETTVLAHLPSSRKGTGIKSPDWWGVHACATCHDIIDGRRTDVALNEQEIDDCIVRALYRTWDRLIAAGLITIQGEKR